MDPWIYVAFVGVVVLAGILSTRRRPLRPLTDEDRTRIERLVSDGRHIEALVAYRKATNASVKDAKVALQLMERDRG